MMWGKGLLDARSGFDTVCTHGKCVGEIWISAEDSSNSGKATVLSKLLGPKTFKIFYPENA